MNYRKYKPQRFHYYGRNYYSFEGDLPEINNESLIIDPSTYLRTIDDKNQVVNSEAIRDLKYLNQEVWTMLVNKYKGGPEILFTIPQGTHRSEITDLLSIKVVFIILPLRSQLVSQSINEALNQMKEYTIYCEKTTVISNIKKKIGRIIIDNKLLGEDCSMEDFADNQTRLWLKDDDSSIQFIQEEYKQVAELIEKNNEGPIDISSQFRLLCMDYFSMARISNIFGKKEVLNFCFEISTEKSLFLFKPIDSLKIDQCEYDRVHGLMTVCCQCKQVWYCNKNCLEKDKRFHDQNCANFAVLDDENLVQSNSSINGLCGLSNLGNTCFMNTALQCLSNCPQLTKYFLSDKYKKNINEDNPLGTKGIMAKIYANLLKNLWYGNSSVFDPSYFKRALGIYLKMFSGFNQHDTQEFLNFLLDKLHEDLNKVLKKPTVERDDRDLPDEIKSKSHWISFLRRNQSVLVDLLYGQFKSTLICPNKECNNISMTFDPFLSISLPLVSKQKVFSIQCFFILYNIKSSPLFFKIPFYSDTTFMALRNKLADLLNIHPWSFVIVKIVDNKRIDEFIPETKSLHSMHSFETPRYFVFQIDPDLFYSPLNEAILNSMDNSVYQKDFSDSEKYVDSRIEITQKVYSNEYEETARNPIKDTNNNCMSPEFVGVVIKMLDYSEDIFIFPRAIFLNKKLSMKELYLYLYKTYWYIVRHEIREQSNSNNHSQGYNRHYNNYNNHNKDENEIEEEEKKEDQKDKDSVEEMMIKYKSKLESIKEISEFDSQIENQSLPFYIIYIPKARNEPNTKLYPFQEGILEDYVNKFNDESDTSYFSNKLFSLGLVWNRSNQLSVTKTLNKFEEPTIRREESLNSISIYECFNRFSKKEVLEENNEWYCPKCKEHQRASKKIDIYKTPNVLIVHLKRFNNNSKLDILIDFPIRDLDISKYVIDNDEKETKYDLFAIANHYGSMGFGHYISFAKNHKTGIWYEFDDSRVSRKNESDLVNSSAYVLFYAKKGIDLIDWNETYDRPFVNYETTQEEKKEETIEIEETPMIEIDQKPESTKEEEEKKEEVNNDEDVTMKDDVIKDKEKLD